MIVGGSTERMRTPRTPLTSTRSGTVCSRALSPERSTLASKFAVESPSQRSSGPSIRTSTEPRSLATASSSPTLTERTGIWLAKSPARVGFSSSVTKIQIATPSTIESSSSPGVLRTVATS